jgi:hypothetical protein
MRKPDIDAQFFLAHPDRKFHIREPGKDMVVDQQRRAHVVDECEREFRSLGEHKRERRRIVLCRADHRGNLLPGGRVLKIPFLLFADETVEDRDDVLAPIVFQMMFERQEPQQTGF